MKVSSLQRKTLRRYQGLQSDQASVFGQIRRNIGIYIYLMVVAIIVVPIGMIISQNFGMLLIGIILGYIIRDVRHFIATKQVWPIMADIINWGRIEELLSSDP